jgi:hypothetical protein
MLGLERLISPIKLRHNSDSWILYSSLQLKNSTLRPVTQVSVQTVKLTLRIHKNIQVCDLRGHYDVIEEPVMCINIRNAKYSTENELFILNDSQVI